MSYGPVVLPALPAARGPRAYEGATALDPNDPQDVAASDHLAVLAVFGF